jgi:hypothetical protein
MTNKILDLLKKDEEIKEEIRDTRLHIKDMEAELDHFHVREPNEVESIARIEKHIDDLYISLDKLYCQLEKNNETNEISKS